ncbi:nucleolar protein 12 isoform X2 [Trichosurus vulpecula]|uniref:nucleolar protein 12 isoform X2 n=1 Tax=Trichosurus vulpecula TaxID=9337 RepID=UPI00186AEDAB|nr:nucleolar protein 12 isoform X2 [Trichosurus vulpecula]
MARKKKNKKDRDGSQGRLVLTFDEEKRRDYLTGFHKRKVERRKVALEEIRKKLKEEQRKLRDERHKEYLKMLKDREAALEEADELDQLVTSKTQCVQYDHPNHTVTVTTISDLDLSGARRLGLPPPGHQSWSGKKDPQDREKGTLKQREQRPSQMDPSLLCPRSLGAPSCLRGSPLSQPPSTHEARRGPRRNARVHTAASSPRSHPAPQGPARLTAAG